MRRVLLASLVFAVAGTAFAAEPPVTRREFSIFIAEIEGAFNRGLKLGLPVRKPSADKTAMPRSEILAEMDKLFEASKPKFTMTPRPYRYDEELIRKHNKAADADRLIKLCRWGVVSPAGPLAIGPDTGLTPLQLGDALGSFVIQISALTHQPNPLWSPPMMKGGA
jgi:hypothetical protein